MSPTIKNTYLFEAVFLVDPAKARQNEKQTTDELTDLINRSGAKLVNLAHWTDRELAYAIHKNHLKFTRAVYFIAHFNAQGAAVTEIERSCHNLDWVVRSIVVRDQDGTVLPGDLPPKPADDLVNRSPDADSSQDIDNQEEGA